MTRIGLPARRMAAAKCRSVPVIPARASMRNRIASQSVSAVSVWARMRPASVSGSPSSSPAVSTTVKARSYRRASPSRRSRVTPGWSSTSASFLPTRRLNKVDLPTFGRPMIATLLMKPRSLGGAVRRDEGEPAFGELALGRRDFRVAEHVVELLARVVSVAAADRQRAEGQLGEPAVGTIGGGERRQRRRSGRLLTGNVELKERRAQLGRVAEQGIDRAVAGDGLKGCNRRGWVGRSLGAGLGHLGENAVAPGRIRRELGEAPERLARLAGVEGGDRRLELLACRLSGPLLLILPVAESGRGEHDQQRRADDIVLVLLPQLRRLVAPDLLVDFLKDISHFVLDPQPARRFVARRRRIRARPNTAGRGKRAKAALPSLEADDPSRARSADPPLCRFQLRFEGFQEVAALFPDARNGQGRRRIFSILQCGVRPTGEFRPPGALAPETAGFS